MLDKENQMMTENLANKVSFLRGIAFDMENETKDQNRYLSGMNSDFDSTEGLLGGSVNRISHMVGSGKNNRKLMCYLILFLVGLFLVSYYLISWVRGG
jgi:blocked-early-in-transport protein 1